MNGLEQLDEWTFDVHRGEFMPAVEVHDLAKKRDLFYTARDQLSNFANNFVDRTTALPAARPRHNAKCAMHVAALHDRNERGRLPRFQFVVANRRGRPGFLL